MRILNALPAVALVALVAPTALHGQRVGERVRVTTLADSTLVGQVVELTDAGFILAVSDSRREEITPRRGISKLERSLGPRSGSRWLSGLLAGTGLGFASAGIVCGQREGVGWTVDPESECMDDGVGATLVGAGVVGGLVVGYLIKTEKWQTIPISQVGFGPARTAGHLPALALAFRIPF